MGKINKDITFKASQGLHKASLDSNSVAIESNAKSISKETKEYLAKRLEDIVDFRNDVGRARKHSNDNE